MAEAFAKIHGKNILEAYSAGSHASRKVNNKAIKSMLEIGYDLRTHKSKTLNEIPDIEYDFAITMGCGDECPHVRAQQRLDWAIPDPKNMNEPDFNDVRSVIEKKVLFLINQMSE
jgi:protein-tyrosine-phosphatase